MTELQLFNSKGHFTYPSESAIAALSDLEKLRFETIRTRARGRGHGREGLGWRRRARAGRSCRDQCNRSAPENLSAADVPGPASPNLRREFRFASSRQAVNEKPGVARVERVEFFIVRHSE